LGCRKPLTPNIDRNAAPETWITAAPLDTLTVRDQFGRPIGNPPVTTIPVRFHVFWAGSDKDGTVAGFYYAVVETTATPTDGVFPDLPGPKPGDYHYTTKTDTTFTFSVSELFTDRKHAFYIYAVDNQGKPDPTPARFIFNAIDKFPPRPVITLARATGEVVHLTADGEPISEIREYFVTDTLKPGTLPKDTVPAFSRLDFQWRGELTMAGTYVAGYRYKLDESQFQTADSSVRSVSYGTGLPGSLPIAPGQKIFTLRALDQAGGAGETTRRCIMNFSPDTWWAGPDPALFTNTGDGEYNSRSLAVSAWPSANNPVFVTDPPLPAGSTFGPDSFLYRPSKRYPPNRDLSKRTFYEVYKNRIYARSEFDTVHMNSYVILWNGGYDKDSRYTVRADSTDPILHGPGGGLLTGPVLENAARIGSPIGFRSLIVNRLTPSGLKSTPAQTSIYPVYEPASVFRSPRLGGYWRMFQAGKAYAVARAEDADGGLDNSVGEPVALADAVDNNLGTPDQVALRRKVMVFYVDKAPALIRTGSPQFLPYDGQTINTIQWDFFLRGMDLDPFNPAVVGPPAGGPTSTTVIRYKITLYGKNLADRDTAWTYVGPSGQYILQGTDVAVSFTPGGSMAANPFASGPIRVSIQICDCPDCEGALGQGRCVEGIDPLTRAVLHDENVITVNYVRPVTTSGLGTTSATGGRPGPDSSGGRD
jgi:hypothetical protein